MTRILFYLDKPDEHAAWMEAFKASIPDVDLRIYPNWGSPEDGPAYAFVWHPKPGLIAEYYNITHVFSFGAGVDHILKDNSMPKALPVIRMSDDGLKDGMAEFVLLNVLMHHRLMPSLLSAQRRGEWIDIFPPAAEDINVGMLGYGALAIAAAKALHPVGYNLSAWSRTTKADEDGIKHYTGRENLPAFLSSCDILVCLLPATPDTDHLLNAETLAMLPKGAAIINAGRGNLIDLDALVCALNSGHLSGASLDVFPIEPLPKDSPIWQHEKIIISPHVAAVTRPVNAAQYVAENIRLIEKGQEPTNLLDRTNGY